MALFKISKGLAENLPTTYNEGYCYVTTDGHKMYIDSSSSASGRFALNASNADSADKLNSDAGKANIPIYFSGGKPVAITATIGANDKPVFISSGAITASTLTQGSTTKFIYMSNGQILETSATVGSASCPVFLSSGAITKCTPSSVFPTLSWTGGTTSGPVLTVKVADQSRTAEIPSASGSASGIVTTGTQTFAGAKTFSSNASFSGTVTAASKITANGRLAIPSVGGNWLLGATPSNASIQITTTNSSANYHPLLAVTTQNGYVANLGTYIDEIGFYGLTSGQTSNSTNGKFVFNPSNGNVTGTGTVTAPTFVGALSGNATTATTLKTSRAINGTSFNGSGDIITSYWGTARNIYIADSSATNTGAAVSVNGSDNVTLKLPATIKASLTGNASTASSLATARTLSWIGDATGSLSFSGSADVSTTLTLADSGVTAGNYGPSTNASPGVGGTFSVPYFTVDAKGRITAASTKTITMPTDTKVTNTVATTTKAYVTGTTSSSTNTGTQVFDTGVYLSSTAGELVATKFTGALNGNAATASKLGTSTVGSGTYPIYLSSGTATTCSQYAGGTAVTLNGTSKAANTASFYAPTTAGTSGQVLKSAGSGAPSWVSAFSTLSWTGGTTSGPVLNATVAGIAKTATIPSASGSASGVVNTTTQSFAGAKTFNSAALFAGGLQVGTSSESVSITYNTSTDTLTITFP